MSAAIGIPTAIQASQVPTPSTAMPSSRPAIRRRSVKAMRAVVT